MSIRKRRETVERTLYYYLERVKQNSRNSKETSMMVVKSNWVGVFGEGFGLSTGNGSTMQNQG